MKSPDITLELFMAPGGIVRMGVPPVRIEILNRIDGANFTDCLTRAVAAEFDDIRVPLIALSDSVYSFNTLFLLVYINRLNILRRGVKSCRCPKRIL